MSISNLFPEKVLHDAGFGTNTVNVNQFKVRDVTTTKFNVELSKVGGLVTCIVPKFQVVSYIAGTEPQAWITVFALPAEFRPVNDLISVNYVALGSAPTVPVLFTYNVDHNGFITFTTNPINISLATSLPANTYTLNDVCLTWQVPN